MTDKKKEMKEDLVKVKEQEIIKFDNFTNLNEALAFCAELYPKENPKDVLNKILVGKELGFGTGVSLANFHIIEGKTTTGLHIINALLLRAGVTMEIIEDYAPLYEYKDKSNIVYKKDDLPPGCIIGTFEQVKEGKADVMVMPKATDYRTSIKFTRLIKRMDGKYKEMAIIESYCLSEAITAELYPKKDNWRKNAKAMMKARVIAKGGRVIADDVLLGIYETSELTDDLNIKVNNDLSDSQQEKSNKIEEAEIL